MSNEEEEKIRKLIKETSERFGLKEKFVELLYEKYWKYYGKPLGFKGMFWKEIEAFIIGYLLRYTEVSILVSDWGKFVLIDDNI